MKKLIIISIVTVLTLGLAIWESTFSTSFYTKIYDKLELVEQSIDTHEDVYNDETLFLMHDVMDEWKRGKEILFCFGNHTALRTVDEKLVSLDAMININYTDDAKVLIQVSKSIVQAMSNDTVPVPSNLF